MLCHVALIGNRFIFTLHSVTLGATPLETGLLLAGLMVGPMLMSVHFGRWSDQFGYARPCAMGIAMMFLSGIVAALGGSMPTLFVASALTGCGFMLGNVAIMNAIGKLTHPQDMTRAFSTLAMMLSLSALTGPLIGGFVIDYLGHATAYLAIAVFSAASAVQLWWATRRYILPVVPVAALGTRRLLDLLENRPLRMVFMASGLISMGWDTFSFLAPLQGIRAGLSATATGMVMGTFAVGMFAIRLGLPAMAKRLSEWRIISLAMLITAAGFIAFPLFTSFWPLAASALLLGMSLGCSQPIIMTLLHHTSPEGRAGESVGVRATISSFSQTMLPILFGGLGSAVGLVAVFWCAAVMLLAGAASSVRQR